jgi:hypothetical protein
VVVNQAVSTSSSFNNAISQTNATLISPFQALLRLRTWPRTQRHATAASASVSSSQKPKIPENATPELPSGVNPGLQFSPSVYSASLFTVLWPLTTRLTHPQEAFSKYQTVTCAKTWGVKYKHGTASSHMHDGNEIPRAFTSSF